MPHPKPLPSQEHRQRAARVEFAQWRERNPHFTSKELLDAWREIRVRWKLMAR